MTFQLKSDRKETENKTIRFPVSLLDRIDYAIKNQDVTFSSFVIQACEYALNNMELPKRRETEMPFYSKSTENNERDYR